MQGPYVCAFCSRISGYFSFLSVVPSASWSLLHGCLSYANLAASSCSEAGWKGVIGEVPGLEQVQAALTERDLYM